MSNDDSGDACPGFVTNLCAGYESSLADRPAEVYADFFLPYLSAESSVLDVGCGNGALTIGLAGTAGHVTGGRVA